MTRMLALAVLLAAAGLAAGTGLPAWSPPSAVDYYLKIGDIKGEAADGSIGVTGIAWDSHAEVGRFAVDPPAEILARYGGAQFGGGGMAAGIAVSDSGVGNPKPAAREGQVRTPRESGSGMATGRRTYNPIRFVKRVDKASPLLMQACANGSHLGDAEVWEREGGRETLRYTLKDVVISSYGVSWEEGAERPTESLSLNFEKIEMAAPARAVNLNSSKSN